MVKYNTNKENCDENVFPYLNTIKEEEVARTGTYSFMIKVKEGGLIDCQNDSRLKEIADLVLIDSTNCSEEIDSKLKELTKD